MKTYVIQTTLPSVIRIRAEIFRFSKQDQAVYFSVEGRDVAAFPTDKVVAIAEKPFGFGNVAEPAWQDAADKES